MYGKLVTRSLFLNNLTYQVKKAISTSKFCVDIGKSLVDSKAESMLFWLYIKSVEQVSGMLSSQPDELIIVVVEASAGAWV